MTPDRMTSVVRKWMKGTVAKPPDARTSARQVMARMPHVRQRGRWWPLPTFDRTPKPTTTDQTDDYQPMSTPATNGHAPTASGRTRSMFSPTKAITAGALVFALGGFLLIAQPFEQQGGSVPGAATGGPGTFGPAGSLAEARFAHTATLLSDGRVLVVGGLDYDQDTLIAPAEVWDPGTATFGPAGSLAQGRAYATATLLPDGRVLIVGGGNFGDPDDFFASAEVWDPATESFSPAGSLADGRWFHDATLLPDGRVLILGGDSGDESFASTEVWDPATESFGAAGSLAEALDGLTATLLSDGRVLIVGGSRGDDEDDSDDLTLAQFWDPATESSSPAGSLAGAPSGHIAMRLPGDRVLIVDGYHNSGFPAHVWDPATESFGPARWLDTTIVREVNTATLLPDGRVLIVGTSGFRMSTEIWDPATESLGPAGSLYDARTRMIHTATLLPDGRVLIVGGGSGAGLVDVAEVWTPGSA